MDNNSYSNDTISEYSDSISHSRKATHITSKSRIVRKKKSNPTKKISKAQANSSINTKNLMTPIEKEKLAALVIAEKRDWKKIAKKYEKMSGKNFTPEILRTVFYNSFSYGKKGEQFKKEDDDSLLESIEKNGLNWINIAKEFPGRCPLSLRNRYYKILRNTNKSSPSASESPKSIDTEDLQMMITDIKFEKIPRVFKFIENLMNQPKDDIVIPVMHL